MAKSKDYAETNLCKRWLGVVYFFDAVRGEPLTEHLLVELASGRDRRADSLRASQGLMPCIPAWVVVASNE